MLLEKLLRPYRQRGTYLSRPLASKVLSTYLRQRSYPSWTSYFIEYRCIQDDNFGQKHFNFSVDGHNYHVLRVGCYPYIKYHCTKRPYQDLLWENRIFKLITVANLGIPCLAYGIAATFLIKHTEFVSEPESDTKVPIHFLIKEDHD
uniref:Uncharacterized protein n=1 Tax=Plectus sambesii TaxID=2011161 RepID=A0A914VNK9_9BILA